MDVINQFRELAQLFAESGKDYTPPWGLANHEQIQALCLKHDCRFPPSFILFHTKYSSTVPCVNGLKFPGAPESASYLNLDFTIQDARNWGIPDFYLPFWEDNAEFLCFDTREESSDGEFPVVRCDHEHPEEDDLSFEHATFLDWLYEALKKRA